MMLFILIVRKPVIEVKLFFYWAFQNPRNMTVLKTHFPEFKGMDVKDVLEDVRDAFKENHMPYHVNLGPKHKVSMEFMKEDQQTFWSEVYADEYLSPGKWVAFSADGFYIRTENFGGHIGQKEMYSYKGCHLSKVKILTCIFLHKIQCGQKVLRFFAFPRFLEIF